ncbi:hypothetical protein PUNSTDRAFT_54446 [Punctularia strigosozonata HHB-11173 SS5]|uniref:uncharacterized protein n=1 Tax=Punctularia strigosozonata (strain HHB-11173) TaxID=741275 RepID=UPI000441799A|nr:uncharacterized protein PUNSTDRAFT_54446 [Punctularia strigosozonata HHB-11173 SS5]EIN06154.1 hypothetical protein PUNSTDRAFT_54446 [Punctularia strigosozonata HHB-11173 SS5]
MNSQAQPAGTAKNRHYSHLAKSLTRLSQEVARTADLCEQLQVDILASRTLSATHAAQFIAVAEELNPEGAGEDDKQA